MFSKIEKKNFLTQIYFKLRYKQKKKRKSRLHISLPVIGVLKMKKVLLYGDSFLTSLSSEGNNFRIINKCVPGLTIKDALSEDKENKFSIALKDKYDIVILCLGTNDIAEDALIYRDVIPNLLKLVEKCEFAKQIGVFGFPYSEIASKLLKKKLRGTKVTYLEFPFLDTSPELVHEDGFHLNEKGKEYMLGVLCSFLNSHELT